MIKTAFSAVKGWFGLNAVPILQYLLVGSVAMNILLAVAAKDFYDKAHEIKYAVQAQAKQAEEKKRVIETRQAGVAEKVGADTTQRIADATRRVRASGYIVHMPPAASPPKSPDGAGETPDVHGPNTGLFISEDDAETCITNTLKAEGWQDFHLGVKAVADEEGPH